MDSSNPSTEQIDHQCQLNDALEIRDALTDILRAMDESSGQLVAIFDVILNKALKLCHARFGIVFLYEEGYYEAVGMCRLPEAHEEWFRQAGRFKASHESALARIAQQQKLVHIEDVGLEGAYKNRDPIRVATVELGKARTFLAVPLMNQNLMVGAFAVYRQDVRKFSDSEVALVQTFARNAAIAVEHTKLLSKVRLVAAIFMQVYTLGGG